jgi:hypothetical protein
MYFPKSKIIPNQYTNGNELVYVSDKKQYEGYYHILATGKIFTGKDQNDGELFELEFASNRAQTTTEGDTLPISPTSAFALYDFSESKLPYDTIRQKKSIPYPPTGLIEPYYIKPSPNYPSFTRYFVKRVNGVVFVEIDQNQYSKFTGQDRGYNWAAYIPFELPWTTLGELSVSLAEINKRIVLLTEQRLKLLGLSKYITNYAEFT